MSLDWKRPLEGGLWRIARRFGQNFWITFGWPGFAFVLFSNPEPFVGLVLLGNGVPSRVLAIAYGKLASTPRTAVEIVLLPLLPLLS